MRPGRAGGVADAAEHALQLVDDALGGLRRDVRHVAHEQGVRGELVERPLARDVLVDRRAQRRIGLRDVIEPDGIADGMQRGLLARHQRQRLAQQLGAALDAHFVSQSDLNNGVYKGPPSLTETVTGRTPVVHSACASHAVT